MLASKFSCSSDISHKNHVKTEVNEMIVTGKRVVFKARVSSKYSFVQDCFTVAVLDVLEPDQEEIMLIL